MTILVCSYSDPHRPVVRLGDTLRILVQKPDTDSWTGNVAIKTSLSASATDDVALSDFSGGRVNNQNWDLYNDYDTSSIPLVANTTYLAIAELVNGSKKIERVAKFTVLPQGRS